MLGATVAHVRVSHLAVAAALVPVVGWRLALACRGVDPAALRAAKTLGIGRWRRWTRLMLPNVALVLLIDVLVTGIVAIATIFLLAFSLGRVGAYTAAP
jgi:ABC-type spermidine/putrescine transport system permease subunit II